MGNDRRSKEASDTGQWERMQTGRVSEHFWAKSDYVRRSALRRYCMERMASSQLPLKHIL